MDNRRRIGTLHSEAVCCQADAASILPFSPRINFCSQHSEDHAEPRFGYPAKIATNRGGEEISGVRRIVAENREKVFDATPVGWSILASGAAVSRPRFSRLNTHASRGGAQQGRSEFPRRVNRPLRQPQRINMVKVGGQVAASNFFRPRRWLNLLSTFPY